ncbi:MAG: hypothetical protein ACPL1Y_06320, partial [Thermoplasmata archaeon]
WVSNLKPSTTYTFTVHSYYGGDLSKSSSGTTRMEIVFKSDWIVDSYSNGQPCVWIQWKTSTASGLSNHKATVKATLPGGQTITQTLVPTSVVVANTYWWYVVFIIDTQQRTIKNVQLDVEIKATYAGYTETACGSGTGYKDSDGDKLYDGEEWYYGTSPDKADTDYDGSWDSTEVWFMKSGANPLFQQRVIRVYIYGYGFGYSGRFYLTVNEIRTPPTGWIEFTGGTSYSPWTEVCVLYPVSSTYAAIQWYVYVDFYSLSVSDLSGVGTSACNLDSNDPFIRIGWGNYGWLWLTYSTPKASPDEPPWAPLARALAPYQIYEDMNQEFPTSIFFDGDRNMANNGLPATWPDGTGNRRWHKDNAINSALANSGYVGKGYYAKSDYEKKVSLTTVYLQGYQQGNLLGI